jgi:hypothetical protein
MDQVITVTKTATARVIKAADIERYGSIEAARTALDAETEGAQDNG